ncbi:hypothetical protein BSL78_22080 [Apostichopus japonicus]|uniref:GDNF/GAS1 domain-containing protein n=1 Tax=Stichopus japonicus TaxID=307972 RepID=A0A2G8JZA6_STIJA|nr:hypothetical protein BSL78_22080 [Apostichopus japonicus]
MTEQRCNMTWMFFNGSCKGQATNSITVPQVQSHTCVDAEQTCLRDSKCATTLRTYTENCVGLSESVCSTLRGNCGVLKSEVDETILKDCICPVENDTDITCEQIWETFHKDPCVSSCETILHEETLIGGEHDGGSTCQTAVDQCYNNSTCYSYFSSYLSACLIDMTTGRCNHDQCMRAMRDVFTTVPPSLTHALVFCYCKEDDSLCHGLKSALSPQCVEGDNPTVSCLTIKTRCEAKPAAGDYALCRNAFVGTFGTLLSTTCICEEAEPVKQDICLQYLRLITQNPCVEKASKSYFTDLTEQTKSGCFIPTSSDDERNHGIMMPTGVYAKFSSQNSTRQTACLCSETGRLVDCFSFPANHISSCDQRNESQSVTSVTHTPTSQYGYEKSLCTCVNGERVCINERIESVFNTPALDLPFLLVAYSEKEVALVNNESRRMITTSAILGRLEDVLKDILKAPNCYCTDYKEYRHVLEFSFTAAKLKRGFILHAKLPGEGQPPACQCCRPAIK